MKTYLCPALLVAFMATGCDTTGNQRSSATAEPSATATAPATTAAPKIAAVEKVFEFGKVKLGSTVEHTFKVRNDGAGPLHIQRAKGS